MLLSANYLRGMDTHSWEATQSILFCLPSEKVSTLKGKNLFIMAKKYISDDLTIHFPVVFHPCLFVCVEVLRPSQPNGVM